ncbi:hypothetical protein D0Z07_9314 [Hyphodiscus hymeniophilus]|uniref:Transcription factor domain-containing protein n=1 Tax=Hyphodiscus hymeniophilus TaxID=353542 RepID=A0A9P6VC51_9HELO|nr:hypothetical protein D0Z07_9314 [Hyphodiscus hymeniophilus]
MCEGYNQRIVFKDPLNLYHGPILGPFGAINVSSAVMDTPKSSTSEPRFASSFSIDHHFQHSQGSEAEVSKSSQKGQPVDVAQGSMIHVEEVGHKSPSRHSEIDEDPYDVSDEDDTDLGQQSDGLPMNDLGSVIALQARQVNTESPAGLDVLQEYKPTARVSPLSDTLTAHVYCYFINSASPTLSLFERHPANPGLIFEGNPVPASQQHIWAYTMPIMALEDQTLLHSILAIGSLHIASVRGGSIIASLKHYTFALRRTAKHMSLPTRRNSPATLGATLLLAWYELMNANHQNWTAHLLGARQLVTEIDFVGKERCLEAMRVEQQDIESPTVSQAGNASLKNRLTALDLDLLAVFRGNRVFAKQSGEVFKYSERELKAYETERDLFWWYCKQDSLQSLLSGRKPFLDTEQRCVCLPRAPIGLINATVAEFAAEDVTRKRKVKEANGDFCHPHSSHPQDTTKKSNERLPELPPVMTESVTMHKYHDNEIDRCESDIARWTKSAEHEWECIRAAFYHFKYHVGEDFQSLGPEFSEPIQTPFGPALQYRTYAIAAIWLAFNMGLIVHHRAHPSMAPGALVALGVTATKTAAFANSIGCIAAGIAPDVDRASYVSPGVSAALGESMFALFIAGVQYETKEQRSWTLSRLSSISRLTGSKTGLAFAEGCEFAWTKIGELGKGPLYRDGLSAVTRSSLIPIFALGIIGVEE